MHYILYRIQYIQFASSNVFFFVSCLFVLFGSWVTVGMLMLNEMARQRERETVYSVALSTKSTDTKVLYKWLILGKKRRRKPTEKRTKMAKNGECW